MNSFNLVSYLSSNIDIDENQIKVLVENCKSKTVVKGNYLLQEGEKCKHTFFVEQGLLRQYSIDSKGKEHILQFASEGWFVSDRESVYFNQAANYYIQALETSKVLFLDEQFILELSKTSSKFVEFNNRLLHNHIRNLQKRINLLLSATAEERYLDFITVYPDVLMRVPQSMVASYLGIAPESLSRVRKDMAKKHFTSSS